MNTVSESMISGVFALPENLDHAIALHDKHYNSAGFANRSASRQEWKQALSITFMDETGRMKHAKMNIMSFIFLFKNFLNRAISGKTRRLT